MHKEGTASDRGGRRGQFANTPGEPSFKRAPRDLPRRGLRREEAAAYVGVSPSKFDAMMDEGDMPKPWRFGGCVVWDIRKLDRALDALDDDQGASDWD